MKPCRDCQREVSEQAFACPQGGAPYPARESWDGWGYEYKSELSLAGLPTFVSALTMAGEKQKVACPDGTYEVPDYGVEGWQC